MKRWVFVCVLVALSLPPVATRPASGVTAAQAGASPTPATLSEPVRSGDWTVQVLDVERRDSYYAERLGQVFEPEGVFLIVGLAVTYVGDSQNQLDRYLPGSISLHVTTPDGTSYPQSQEAFAAFGVEESYRQDTPYPRLPSNGVAEEPDVTYYVRYIFDVPADTTGLELTNRPGAPDPFSIPLPDPPATEDERVWDLTVLETELRATLEPPLTVNQYEAEGVYVVVHVRLEKLTASPGGFTTGWFRLRTAGGEEFETSYYETSEMRAPGAGGEPGTWEFALVFDLPAEIDPADAELTLVNVPGSPILIEELLAPVLAPTPTPTATATATASPTPTATPAPTATAAPTATPSPPATATPTEPPEPGGIRVVSGGGGVAAGQPVTASFLVVGAVELILDTSGSMLQPMGDQLRIDVAKEVMTGVVTETLPAGAQTALRVFGTEPGSCETSLTIPLGPLDPEAAAAAIADLRAVNEVRTPLGASLEAAGADLAAVEGPKLIVLVTDGEETCGGDPGAVIDALVAQGIDVRVNIVGFAIDDPAVEQTLADWAERGGGVYFPATDADDLGPALAQALQPTFDVLDSDGFRVAGGTVDGEAVPVPAGRYTVRVNADPPVTIERVVVEPGETTEVRLDEDGG